MLNKQSGNMYGFITHTWNTVKGKCSHDCIYCYMKRFPQNQVRFDEKELKTNLGEGNFIFVGSGNDVFANNHPDLWIAKTITRCLKYPKNNYLFQTKNTERMFNLYNKILFPVNSIFCTTIESNRIYNISNAPKINERLLYLYEFKEKGEKVMITIEPIFDFDVKEFVSIVKSCSPIQVNIGADSKKHNLPEPDEEKIKELIIGLQESGIKVFIKENLKRLTPNYAQLARVCELA
jgi:DNA repair photolyase